MPADKIFAKTTVNIKQNEEFFFAKILVLLNPDAGIWTTTPFSTINKSSNHHSPVAACNLSLN